ncbi:bifunctional phosphopantothenoylcysteine decarboxylase/phosphopantothenate--cysteine ligase CoaBC [Coxiella endosymbiont of Amblyomma nuttalli]|uniref:bifunctional phosphopantothenoylcysteine decarboxylase/phosphopantothenate--cysteine ligase CoaBC n=1 Tax=Coxiella endosymbiont of Amblyomma nuttalli TaxID=2749996 RepID=UPI001BA4EC9E|nr:bifunctional phosphopantothenoylcysteine decarboxylase/phosphopantothenate--cysteine ligase CoaBC [Coxiella endosymbiont of Amblyomma nuttalli]QTS84085.1 Coenzyme A biosynthesis bifunctional protein CoaBC [Coxiella endosymbiont of Amblyomma nuttalli]
MLTNQKFLIGVTGAIAIYKSIELIRRLRDEGALVRVVMTESAKAFVTPLAFQTVSGHSIANDLFVSASTSGITHIDLARWCDFILIAPASADFISRLAYGRADDMLTTLCLAAQVPIAVAPSMNQQMWLNKIMQVNINRLREYGICVFGPTIGMQVCGEYGPGRLLEPEELINQLKIIYMEKILLGKRILITAGPTQEAIDPVRYLTNHSSGKMGYALAEAAVAMGAEVTLISGPTQLVTSHKINCINVTSTMQMFDAVMQRVTNCDVFIGAAAVSDYRAKKQAFQKIKKSDKNITLDLVRNPDIISSVGKLSNKPFIVGFALETDNNLISAKTKLRKKNMDMIVVNSESALNSDQNVVTVIDRLKQMKNFSASKTYIAIELMKFLSQQLS